MCVLCSQGDRGLYWRYYAHFAYLALNVEEMMVTGEPTYPVERVLLTSGVLEAAVSAAAPFASLRADGPHTKLLRSSTAATTAPASRPRRTKSSASTCRASASRRPGSPEGTAHTSPTRSARGGRMGPGRAAPSSRSPTTARRRPSRNCEGAVEMVGVANA